MDLNTTAQHDATLDRIVRRIVEAVSPRRIVLFGSRAKGTSSTDSDYDVCVIADSALSPRERSTQIQRLFPRSGFSMDVFVLAPGEFDEQKEVVKYARLHGRTGRRGAL